MNGEPGFLFGHKDGQSTENIEPGLEPSVLLAYTPSASAHKNKVEEIRLPKWV